MGVSGVGNSGGSSNLGFGGGDNEDLKAERRAIQRESLKEGNESFKLSEKKKNIEAIR
ncbi:type III secretion effector protein [Pseudomonas shahriarae]|uniref:type III secretion effector protein n=1 Tax=Pseudomonas shahriarae TaxID=2745512 RepID=UPI00236270C8|nr:type III secretion effector protein [Pseudomonas shahriarae]MDD1132064.1 type III secretion effector protein [Pseudomonas shahriarae]